MIFENLFLYKLSMIVVPRLIRVEWNEGVPQGITSYCLEIN